MGKGELLKGTKLKVERRTFAFKSVIFSLLSSIRTKFKRQEMQKKKSIQDQHTSFT